MDTVLQMVSADSSKRHEDWLYITSCIYTAEKNSHVNAEQKAGRRANRFRKYQQGTVETQQVNSTERSFGSGIMDVKRNIF